MSHWRKRFRSHLKALLDITRVDDIPRTVVLWAGPSRLDGAPIMVVASCVRVPSENGKTEDMIQVAIMSQTHAPMDAWILGLDGSVCPVSCIHRSKPRGGKGSCYVSKARLYDTWRAAIAYLAKHGKNGRIEPDHLPLDYFKHAHMRFGMEGDPSAVPLHVWQYLAAQVARWTGYTADWANLAQDWADLFMASVSSIPDMLRAKSLGWRPFFSSFDPKDDAAAVTAGLRLCLAESKAAVGCSRCGGCDGNQKGTKRAGFFLPTHGAIGTSLRKHTTP